MIRIPLTNYVTNPYDRKPDTKSFQETDDDISTGEFDVPLEVEQKLRSQLETFRHRLDPQNARVVNHSNDSKRVPMNTRQKSITVGKAAEMIGLIATVALAFAVILWAVL